MDLGLLLGLFGGGRGLCGFGGRVCAYFRKDVHEDHQPDEHQADDKDSFGLDGEAGAVFGKVLE